MSIRNKVHKYSENRLETKPQFNKMRFAHPNPEQKRQYRPKLFYLAISSLNTVYAKPEVDSKEDHIDLYRRNSSGCPTFSTIRCTIDNADLCQLYLISTHYFRSGSNDEVSTATSTLLHHTIRYFEIIATFCDFIITVTTTYLLT
jgi:hypothetical protein